MVSLSFHIGFDLQPIYHTLKSGFKSEKSEFNVNFGMELLMQKIEVCH